MFEPNIFQNGEGFGDCPQRQGLITNKINNFIIKCQKDNELFEAFCIYFYDLSNFVEKSPLRE